MKKILWLTENYPPSRGGMAQSCDRIVFGLRKAGFRIDLIHFTNRGEPGRIIQQSEGFYLATGIWENESHTLMMAWKKLEGLGLEWDLLVVFGGHLPLLSAPVYSAWLNLTLVVFLRGNDFDSAIFSSRKRPFLQDALRQARLVFSISDNKMGGMKKLFPEVDFRYVPNGIDLETWLISGSELEQAKQIKLELAENRLLVGCFGHLKAKKGLDLLLESMKSQMIGQHYQILLIGELEQELLELTEQPVHHLPFKDRYELIPYYAACDLILIPSYYDGMPNVLLEAGALGCLVVGAATDGIADVLTDGVNGFTFKSGDLKALREKLFQVMELNEEEKINLGQKLKRDIYEKFSFEIEIEKYQSALEDI